MLFSRYFEKGDEMKFLTVAALAGVMAFSVGGVFARGHSKVLSHSKSKLLHERKGDGLSVNQASENELKQLPGVGTVMARRIVESRERNGKFKQLKDLLVIKGMSPHKLQLLSNKAHV